MDKMHINQKFVNVSVIKCMKSGSLCVVNCNRLVRVNCDQDLTVLHNLQLRFPNVHFKFVDYFESISTILQLYQYYTKNGRSDFKCLDLMSRFTNTKTTEDKKINIKGSESKSKRLNFVKPIQEVYKALTLRLETSTFNYGSMKDAAAFANITNKLEKYVVLLFK